MIIFYVILIFLQAGVIVYFVRQNRKKPETHESRPVNTFESLRNQSIRVTPAQLKLNIPETQILVYGVIMDWNMGEVTVTLAAYINGAANMYLSTGESITGGGKNPNAGEAAVEFVMASGDYLERAIEVTSAELPAPGCVRFFFLTNHNRYGAQENVKYIQDATSPWLALFEMGNRVMTEMQTGDGKTAENIVMN